MAPYCGLMGHKAEAQPPDLAPAAFWLCFLGAYARTAFKTSTSRSTASEHWVLTGQYLALMRHYPPLLCARFLDYGNYCNGNMRWKSKVRSADWDANSTKAPL